MYICNHTRLALGLEGTPDPSQAVIAAAVTKTGYKGYVAPDYAAAAPAAAAPAAGKPAPPPPAPASAPKR